MKSKRLSLSTLRKSAVAVADIVEVQNEENIDLLHSRTEVVGIEIPRKRKRKISRQPEESLNDEGSDEKDNIRKNICSSVERNNPKVAFIELDSEKVSSLDHLDSGNLCNDKTVYIEGLPYDSTESDVMSFFEACGRVQSVRLPKWHDSGRLRGYGHVQFLSAEAVTKALDLDGEFMAPSVEKLKILISCTSSSCALNSTQQPGCDMKGRYIKVDKPQTPRSLSSIEKNKDNVLRPPGCRSVFVKNIPYDTTEAEITEVFKVCGPITSVRLAVWGNTKQLKGFGYIDFKREDSAEIAVKKSGILSLNGRPVVIDFETGAPKKSFRKPDGKVWSKNEHSNFSRK